MIEIRGIGDVSAWLALFLRTARRETQSAANEALDLLIDWTSEYPPESRANQPAHGSHGPYYIRGTGSAYQRLDGGVSIYGGSENLGQSWQKKVSAGPYDVTMQAGPTASYGPYVHDKTQQADFHARRGWRTTQDAVRTHAARLTRIFKRALNRAIRRVS